MEEMLQLLFIPLLYCGKSKDGLCSVIHKLYELGFLLLNSNNLSIVRFVMNCSKKRFIVNIL